jgi:hypothetical protein
MLNQNQAERVLIGVLETSALSGPLDSVANFLAQLKSRYGRDYLELALEPNAALPGIELTGVRNYSDDTLNKMKQLRCLMLSLPQEAAHEVLQNCADDEDEPEGNPGVA